MEKRGYIDPDWTPQPTCQKPCGCKKSKEQKIEELDKDLTKQAADKVSTPPTSTSQK